MTTGTKYFLNHTIHLSKRHIHHNYCFSSVAFITHPSFIKHKCGNNQHPESPNRLITLTRELPILFHNEIANKTLHWYNSNQMAPKVTIDQLVASGHPEKYVTNVLKTCRQASTTGESVPLDSDTAVSPDTEEAALRAAGAARAAVSICLDKTNSIQHAFCAVRPPGHHAERNTSMGFCLFNNVASAVAKAREQGLKKVVVMDYDVHHGNGSQDMFWNDEDVLFISTHQDPLYPGTGKSTEKGKSGQNILNLPLSPGTSSDLYQDLITSVVIPTIQAWKPELILFSAGFDAHRSDPLANINLNSQDFYFVTSQILASIPNINSVSMLEGGYDVEALVDCSAATIHALLDASTDTDNTDNTENTENTDNSSSNEIAVPIKKSNTLIALHKPKGYVVTRSDELGRKTVYDLLPKHIYQDRWMPIGRLDLASQGILLFTKKGQISDSLTRPGNCIKKYELWLRGHVTDEHIEMALKGVKSKNDVLKVSSIEKKGIGGAKTKVIVEINEGKNRHLRRLFGNLKDPKFGNPLKVLKLKRISIGSMQLEDLESGCWKYLTLEEEKALMQGVNVN